MSLVVKQLDKLFEVYSCNLGQVFNLLNSYFILLYFGDLLGQGIWKGFNFKYLLVEPTSLHTKPKP